MSMRNGVKLALPRPRVMAAVGLLVVAAGYAAVVGVVVSYGATVSGLLVEAPTLMTVILGSCALSIAGAGLLFAPVSLKKTARRYVFAVAALVALLNVALGYLTAVFWPGPMWALWRFYREATA